MLVSGGAQGGQFPLDLRDLFLESRHLRGIELLGAHHLQFVGVDVAFPLHQSEMEVRAGAFACAAHPADHLAFADALPSSHAHGTEVGILGDQAVVVPDADFIAPAA